MSTTPGASRPFGPVAALTLAGWCCIVLGGLVAAVTGPLDLADGSWLAAYLVLVGGVAQVAMGAARPWCRQGTQSTSAAWTQVGAWNLGNSAVIVGTLVGEPLVVDLGSVLLFVALAIAARAARPSTIVESVPVAVSRVYGGFLVALLVSVPVGMVLAHVRHG